MIGTVRTSYPIVDVLLPLTLDALVSAESQVDVFVDQLGLGRDERMAFTLRLVVNEGFLSALNAHPIEGRFKVVRLTLRAGQDGIWVTLIEPGPGFHLQGHYPPYPASLVGQEVCFGTALNRKLLARVESANDLTFRVENRNGSGEMNRSDFLKATDSRGLGVIALCQECGKVGMSYDTKRGNSLSVFYPVRLNGGHRH